MEYIDGTIETTVQELARESMDYIEPICQSCWDEGRDDPLGLRSGVNTPINKRINTLVDQIIEENEEADMAWQSELRTELIEIFYDERRELYKHSDQRVKNTLECYYCYEDRQSDDESLSIRVRNMDESDLFGRSEGGWR